MRDWPSFAARGSKALRNYMVQYKDNFCWQAIPTAVRPWWRISAGLSPSSRRRIARLLDEVLNKTAKDFEALYAGGARALGVKFDDVIIRYGIPDRCAFKGDYGAALSLFHART